MKPDWKTCIRLGVTIFVLYLLIHYWDGMAQLVLGILGAAWPLVLGFVIAYLVNTLMSFYESHYFPKSKARSVAKSRRIVCMLFAFISLLAILYFVVRLIVPELVSCAKLLAYEIPPVAERIYNELNSRFDLPTLFSSFSSQNWDWQSIVKKALNWFTTGFGGVMGTVATFVTSTFSLLVTLLVALIFSIYLLSGKERLSAQMDRLSKTYLKPTWNGHLHYVIKVLNDSFHRFIVGQCIEAVILGTLCIGGMMLFRFHYANMIGTLIGFSALIPIAGAYIGAGIGAFMIFTVSPMESLLFLLFIVILQQLEGNLIYPRVVGASIGLPGLWVLAAITIGGGLMGIAGMLLGVPIAAACYQILKTDMGRRTEQEIVTSPNDIADDLP
ncbi:MAG: AI-2E family transporter [Evtepia sp.]